ncbi:MAG: PAS domain S-box protein [Armatimonadota bacterium]
MSKKSGVPIPEMNALLGMSEGQYRSLVTNLPGGAVFILNRELRYLLADGEAIYAAGMRPSDFEGKTLFEVLEPTLAEEHESFLRRALAGEPFLHEHDAHDHSFCSRGVPLRDDKNTIYAVLVVSYDITDRKNAESALHASEEHYRAIVNQNIAGIIEIDFTGRFLFANQQFSEKFGYTVPQLLRMSVADLTCPEDLPRCITQLEQMKIDRIPFAIEKRLLHSGGTPIWVHYNVSPIVGTDDNVETAVIVVIDISERRRAELALRQVNEQLEARVLERTAELALMNGTQQELLRRLVTAQEEERRRISYELHDQTGQHLTGLLLGLKSLEKSIEAYCPKETEAGALLDRLRGIAEDMAMDVHRIAVDLRPTALDDLGLVPVLRSHVERWSVMHGIAAEFESFDSSKTSRGNDERLPEGVETTIYRVVQEALTNIARHGGSGPDCVTRVSVTLQRFSRHLQVTVEDDGPGFDVKAALQSRRIGLAGMQERASSCGGTLEIESAPGKGTTVFLRIPITASLAP